MKRMLLLTALFFLAAGTASADYVLVKINLNQLDFLPPGLLASLQGGQNPGAPQPGMPPGGIPAGAAGGLQQPNPAMPGGVEDPNAKWVSAFVELRSKPRPFFMTPNKETALFDYTHRWTSPANKAWMTYSPHYPMFANYFPKEIFTTEFDIAFKKEAKDKAKKKPDDLIAAFTQLARQSLARNSLFYFHRAMKEVVDADGKHPIAVNYLRVKKLLDAPFKEQDPAQAESLAKFMKEGYRAKTHKKGHYTIYAPMSDTDLVMPKIIDRRLELLEHTLEIFYYWFVLNADLAPSSQPPLPRYHLTAIMTKDKEEFLGAHMQWGNMPMVGDAFTPRRQNFIVMCARPRVNDQRFEEFDALLTNKLQDLNAQIRQKYNVVNLTLTRENLLSGEVNKDKEAGKVAVFLGAAETVVLLAKTLEDEAERATITNEAIRQILIAAEIFPRNVTIPDWTVEGLAAFFETPVGAVYPTVGSPSWKHFISIKHLRNTDKLDKAPEVLRHVISDHYFQDARSLSAQLQEYRDNEALRKDTAQSWEIARATAWAFVYHLAENKKLELLFKYGIQLNELPRDMDLDEIVLQACFARGFGLTDPANPRRLDSKRFANMAEAWYSTMQVTNLPFMEVQPLLMQLREQQDVKLALPAPGEVTPGVNPQIPLSQNPQVPLPQNPPVPNPQVPNPLIPQGTFPQQNPQMMPNMGRPYPFQPGGYRPPGAGGRPPMPPRRTMPKF